MEKPEEESVETPEQRARGLGSEAGREFVRSVDVDIE